MESAPRRAALRGGLRLATGQSSSTLWMPSFDPRDATEDACEFYSWFGSVRNHHEPGIDGDWRFARVDVHAGEEEDAWLLEAHAR